MHRIAIVLPVFNDWHSLARLIPDLEAVLAGTNLHGTIIAVDDGSTEPPQLDASDWHGYTVIDRIEVLELVANVGHQRAIAIGLAHVHEHVPCDAVIVMDSDGEDTPADVRRLLDMHMPNPGAIVAASRASRSEGALFRAYYAAYKYIFRLLTGRYIDFGNFCLIPKSVLGRITYRSDLWNHLAACIVRSRLPLVRLPTDRGQRYAGQSSMNIVSLIVHGLSAMSVFSDTVFVRLIMAAFALAGATIGTAVVILAVRLGTDWTPPGWASIALILLGIVFLQAILLSVGTIFLHLHGRSMPSVVPAMMAVEYVHEKHVLIPVTEQRHP